MDGYTVKRIDELESIHHGAVKLAAAELGVESFGLQVLDFPAGFSQYPPHDHSEDGQEEVYVVVDGSADFEIAGEHVAAGAGTMVRIAPGNMRRIEPGPNGVRILAIGSTTRGEYERPESFRLAVGS